MMIRKHLRHAPDDPAAKGREPIPGSIAGFSLIEVAVVLFIITLMIGIVVAPLAGQVERQRTADTQKQLESIKEALYGFAMANGRLPCPATSASAGVESPSTGGACTTYSGFIPAATLGLTPVDSGGYGVDAWGGASNRIRYAVASLNWSMAPNTSCPTSASNVLTSGNGIQTATMACFAGGGISLLSVATTMVNQPAQGCTPGSLAVNVPFVLFSLGRNAPSGGTGADEAQNLLSNGTTFVSRTQTDSNHCAGEFDDIVTWGSLNTLFARLVQAGKLP